MTEERPPKELDAIVDKVLAYKPKQKIDAAKTRKKNVKKDKKEKPKPS